MVAATSLSSSNLYTPSISNTFDKFLNPKVFVLTGDPKLEFEARELHVEALGYCEEANDDDLRTIFAENLRDIEEHSD